LIFLSLEFLISQNTLVFKLLQPFQPGDDIVLAAAGAGGRLIIIVVGAPGGC
jgi:hypothetical protein